MLVRCQGRRELLSGGYGSCGSELFAVGLLAELLARLEVIVDVARVVSTRQDRKAGHAILRFRAEDGRVIALRLRPQQFRTLAKGVLGLAKARGEIREIS